MNKFLKLVEETNPEIGYIVEIRGPDGALMGRAGIPGNNTSFYEELAMFLRDRGGDVVGAVEDQEEELTADAAIENAAENDPDSPAGKAVEDRKRKVDQLVAQYVGDTNKIS